MVHTDAANSAARFLARVKSDPRATAAVVSQLERLRLEAAPRRWSEPLDLDVPTIRVDTTDRYEPDVNALLDWVLDGTTWVLAAGT